MRLLWVVLLLAGCSNDGPFQFGRPTKSEPAAPQDATTIQFQQDGLRKQNEEYRRRTTPMLVGSPSDVVH